MSTSLDFIVAVRHHASVENWSQVMHAMERTARSIAAQTSPDWRCVFVANTETPLPAFDPRIEVCRVDIPPVSLPDAALDRSSYFQRIREDKGQRVFAGMRHLASNGYVMVVDYDDLVSNRLAEFVESKTEQPGWFLDSGYLLAHDESVAYRRRHHFNKICGTSLIVHSRHYRQPTVETGLDIDYVSTWLGSHKSIQSDLEQGGHKLKRLPFPGAMWLLGGPGETSGDRTVWGEVWGRSNPSVAHRAAAVARIRNIRRVSSAMRREFLAAE